MARHSLSSMPPPLDRLLLALISAYFSDKYCVVFVSVENILANVSVPILSIVHDARYEAAIRNSLDIGCDAYVVNENNATEFIHVFDYHIHRTEQRRGDRQFIFLFQNEFNISGQKIAEEFLKQPLLKYIPDLLVIYPINTIQSAPEFTSMGIPQRNSYELSTRKFNDSTPIPLDQWNGEKMDFLTDADLFPNKIVDLEGYVLNVSVLNYSPYIIIEENMHLYPNVPPNGTIDGIEMRLLMEFVNKHNCSAAVNIEPLLWGEVYENYTGFGMFGSIVEDLADIGCGSIGSWLYFRPYMEQLYPFVRTGVTCLVPAPRLLDKFNVPILPFTFSLWLAVIGSTIALTIAFYTISQQTKLLNTVEEPAPTTTHTASIFTGILNASYILYGMMLLQPLPESAEYSNIAFRSLLMFILLQTLLISTAYSSGLSAIMTLPRYEQPIKTIQDLVDREMEWGADDLVWIHTISGSTEPKMQHLVKNFRVYDDDELERMVPLRKFAYTIERLQGGSFAIGAYITPNNIKAVQPMQEDLYWEQCMPVLRKSSPFLPYFNDLIFRLRDSGIVYAYERQAALLYLNFRTQLYIKLLENSGDHGGDDEPVILHVSDLLGLFSFWGISLSFACTCFALEICIHHTNNKQ